MSGWRNLAPVVFPGCGNFLKLGGTLAAGARAGLDSSDITDFTKVANLIDLPVANRKELYHLKHPFGVESSLQTHLSISQMLVTKRGREVLLSALKTIASLPFHKNRTAVLSMNQYSANDRGRGLPPGRLTLQVTRSSHRDHQHQREKAKRR